MYKKTLCAANNDDGQDVKRCGSWFFNNFVITIHCIVFGDLHRDILLNPRCLEIKSFYTLRNGSSDEKWGVR